MSSKNGRRRRNVPSMRSIVILGVSLSLSLGLLTIMMNAVSASISERASVQEKQQIIGLTSSATGCLSIGDPPHLPGHGTGVVRLTWQGQIERAQLLLSVAGASAAHTIRVNGQAVALAPVYPGGQPCGDEAYFRLDVPPEVVVQGENLIEITNDALQGDSWTASHVRLQLFGDITPQSLTGLADAQGVAAMTAAFMFTFTNLYDGSSQEAVAQVPVGYDGNTPTPLVIYAHSRTGVMEEGIDVLGTAANLRGWLLASPEMHGSWIVPAECYVYPNDCDYDDQVLAGTTSPTAEPRPGAFAHASLESQYDIIGTARYMVEHYNVKPDQIYLAGYSMGGQIATLTAARFPHLFAAVFDNKGITDLEQWYWERTSYTKNTLRKECHTAGVPQSPLENPFCYDRRSSVNFGSDYLHTPISITHSLSDEVVPIHHSYDLRDAINSYGPDYPASIFVENGGNDGGSACGYHCYEPDPAAVLGFLEPFSLNNTPTHLYITTDESKSYYWMNLAQTGGDHFSQVEVTYSPPSATVVAVISDTHPLKVAFNLGATAIPGPVGIGQPGMGLPATTYLINGGGNSRLENYTSGYLTTTLTFTGRFTLTVSAIKGEIVTDPPMVSGWQTTTSTITARFQDHLNNPIPDGTAVQFSTSAGTFPNANSTYVAATAAGQAVAILTLSPQTDSAEVVASVENISASTMVDVIHPAIELMILPNQTSAFSGQVVTYTYQISNVGDVTLTGVSVRDDNGTPGNSSDDLTVCEGITLPAQTATSCDRSVTIGQTLTDVANAMERDPIFMRYSRLHETTTITAIVTGKDPLGNDVTDTDSATVEVLAATIYLPFVTRNQ